MTKNLFIKTVFYWLVFIPLAIINGTVRNYVYQPFVGDLIGHQISTFSAILLFCGMMFVFVKWNLHQVSRNRMIIVGLLWCGLTILFEFGFGHYIMGHSWEKLFFDYNLFAGRLWFLVLLTLLVGPVCLYQLVLKLQKRNKGRDET